MAVLNVIADFNQHLVDGWNLCVLLTQQESLVTCASRPLVSPNVRSVFGVDLAVFWGRHIQATFPLDGNLKGEE